MTFGVVIMPFSTPKSVDYFANTTFAVGLVPIILGINAILRPASALSILEFPAPPNAEGQRLAKSLMQIYGGRNISLGLLMILIWARGDRRTLGLAMFASIPIAGSWMVL